MTDMNEKYIVYLCPRLEHLPKGDDRDKFLVRDDYPGVIAGKKRFFPDFSAAKEFDTYEEALKYTYKDTKSEAINISLNNFIFIDIHPRYRYD